MNLDKLYRFFYRLRFFSFIKMTNHLSIVVMGSIIANVLILFAVFASYFFPMQPKYYSTSFSNQNQQLVPISEPNTSDYAILQWSNIAIVSAFSYDFQHYKTQLQKVSEYFTEDGWASFIAAIKSSNNLNQVIAKKLIVNAVATNPPIILEKGELNGSYSWRIQMPILVTYQAASGYNPQNLLITILVTRISTLDSYKGIGIEQFMTSDYNVISATPNPLS